MGNKIKINGNKIEVPDDPVVPYIEGDGIGVDIWPTAQNVFDSAILKAYDNKKFSSEKKSIIRRSPCWRKGQQKDRILAS